jgi:hypothetical protein
MIHVMGYAAKEAKTALTSFYSEGNDNLIQNYNCNNNKLIYLIEFLLNNKLKSI